MVATGTGVHRRVQGEIGGEAEGAGGAGQRHCTVFQGLAQSLQLGGADLDHSRRDDDPRAAREGNAGRRGGYRCGPAAGR